MVLLLILAAPVAAMAFPAIQALTVPWVPGTATAHSSWSGNQVTLKGTSTIQDDGSNSILFDWNPGDGGTHCTGAVTNQYDIECVYTYTGSAGTTYNAILTVYDVTTSNGGTPPSYANSSTASYYTNLSAPPPNLPIETNAAIDAGLWYLHKTMNRSSSANVTSVTLTNGGSGYMSDGSTLPNVTFSGCAVSPTATAVVTATGGSVTAINLTSGGSGCVAPVTVTIRDPLAGGGAITGVTIANAGQNYQLDYNGNYYGLTYAFFMSSTGGPAGTGLQTLSGVGPYYPYGTAVVDMNSSSATFGQLTGFNLADQGVGLTAPVTAFIQDEYCGGANSMYNYKQPSQPGYEGDEGTLACGSGAQMTVTLSPITAGGSGASVTANLSAPMVLGDWSNCAGNASACGNPHTGLTATNCTAFEVSGHLENGPASDPYTDDVTRCLASTFNALQTYPITDTKTNSFGTFNPDQNNNGIAVSAPSADYGSGMLYQTGMLMDTIVASNEKTKPVTVGPLASLTDPGTGGAYSYQDAVLDMADFYAYCENDDYSGADYAPLGAYEGGWIYTCSQGDNDNSVSQWAGIGIIPARRNFGSSFPADDLLANQQWLQYSQASNGEFGYTSSSPLWGPYADTPSGMVQLAMNGIGRGATGSPTQFDLAETFIRDSFDTPQTGNAQGDMKDYYYGLFSFTKSMLLHSQDGVGLASSPIQYLQSVGNPGSYPPIDWYAAQNSAYGGTDTSNGVARTLISGTPSNGITGQHSDGSWSGHYYSSEQSMFETSWAVIMLNHTVFQGVPTACATSNSPAADGSVINLNGQCSTDTSSSNSIVEWQWDVSGTAGTDFTLSGVKVNPTLTAPAGTVTFPYSYPVRLGVSDNSTPPLTSDFVFNVVLTTATTPPTANAGGPYNFCPEAAYLPWYLNGSLSSQSPGALNPAAAITSYGWDWTCSGAYNSSSLAQPEVDGVSFFATHNSTPFNVCLQVGNNYGLKSTASSQVTVHSAADPECSHCVSTLSASAKNPTPGVPGDVQLYWTDTNATAFAIDHYNVYRSTSATFSPFVQIAGASGHYPAVKAATVTVPPKTDNFVDGTVAGGTTYYYRISPATVNDTETCGSNLTLKVSVAASAR
jgi:hypothetical protein